MYNMLVEQAQASPTVIVGCIANLYTVSIPAFIICLHVNSVLLLHRCAVTAGRA